MGRAVFSRAAYTGVQQQAMLGGTGHVTSQAETRARITNTLDLLVDPKGFPHLRGPIRLSLPRFSEQRSGLWELTVGIPLPIETLLDTTGSMGDNVNLAFAALPRFYELLTGGHHPVLLGYDIQIANAIFGDVEDDCNGRVFAPVLCRSQFEMDTRIAEQLTLMVPSRNGCGNGKEDPQYGLFGAAYLTDPRILAYGLKGYHFTVSDEPTAEYVNYAQLTRVFGDTVLEFAREMGFDFTPSRLPSTNEIVKTLLERSHGFFLQVGNRSDVTAQWIRLYGRERVVMIPGDTSSLHLIEGVIIGLTEGVISLADAQNWLVTYGADKQAAAAIVRAVSHIPLGAQRVAEHYGRLPQAGSLFRTKTDLWPQTAAEIAALGGTDPSSGTEPDKIGWL